MSRGIGNTSKIITVHQKDPFQIVLLDDNLLEQLYSILIFFVHTWLKKRSKNPYGSKYLLRRYFSPQIVP